MGRRNSVFHRVCGREASCTPEGALRRCAAASEYLVGRMALQRRLEGHAGCVNTVSFNGDGTTLVSGSDDLSLILWDWQTGACVGPWDDRRPGRRRAGLPLASLPEPATSFPRNPWTWQGPACVRPGQDRGCRGGRQA